MHKRFSTRWRALKEAFSDQQGLLAVLRIAEVNRTQLAIPVVGMGLSSLLSAAGLYFFKPCLDILILGPNSHSSNVIVRTYQWLFSQPGELFDYAIFGLVISVGLLILKNILGYYSITRGQRIGFLAIERLREKVFARHLSFGLSYFERKGAGKINHSIINYPQRLSQSLSAVTRLVYISLLVIGHLVLLTLISWQMTVLALLLLPFSAPAAVRIRDRTRHLARELQDVDSNVARKLFDATASITLIKASNAEQREIEAFKEESRKNLDQRFRLVRTIESIEPVTEGIHVMVLLGFCFLYLVFRRSGMLEVSSTSFLVYIMVFRRTASLLTGGYGLLGSLEAVKPHLRACMSILENDKDKELIPNGSERLERIQQNIEFRNLQFSYRPRKPVLKGIKLTIPVGKTTALVGESGVGKSTMVKLLLRFYDCPPNSIFVDGEDIRKFDIPSLRDKVSYVSQDVVILNSSLRENILYGCPPSHCTEERIHRAIRDAGLKNFVRSLKEGLDTSVGERGVCLSNGERQRVSIARALLRNAQVLILDEATSSLDTKTEQEIQSAIRNVLEGRTAIVIAHRLSTIRNAHQIAVIKDGRVVECGSLESLLEVSGHFAAFWHAQNLTSAA